MSTIISTAYANVCEPPLTVTVTGWHPCPLIMCPDCAVERDVKPVENDELFIVGRSEASCTTTHTVAHACPTCPPC
jgi:hypothetical protein